MKHLYIGILLSLVLLFCLSLFHNNPLRAISSLHMQKQDIVWLSVEKKLNKNSNSFLLSETPQIVGQVHAANSYDNAKAYIAVDYQNGNIISQKNENAPVPIASLTKLMSAVITLDLVKSTDTVTVTSDLASITPTKIGIGQGERMSVKEFLEAMLMTSANDAAQAVRDGINDKYHEDIFVRAMNEKAKFLGLTHTHFSNPQGFDGNNYSSAHDLAILTHYALSQYPVIAQIVSQDYMFLPPTSAHKQYDLYNWNGLLDVYPGISGVKIGNTDDAGYTMVVTSERNGKKVLAVILGAPGILERDLWTASLLDDAFQSYGLPPVNVTATSLQAKYATWRYWN